MELKPGKKFWTFHHRKSVMIQKPRTTILFPREKKEQKPPLVVIHTPIPLSQYVVEPDTEGVLFRVLIPLSGMVSALQFIVDKLEVEKTTLVCELYTAAQQFSTLVTQPFTIHRGANQSELEFPVLAGDRYVVRMVDSTSGIRGVWLAFIIVPQGVYQKTKDFLAEVENASPSIEEPRRDVSRTHTEPGALEAHNETEG